MVKVWRAALGAGLIVISLVAASAASAWDGHGHARVLWASPNGGHRFCARFYPCSLTDAVANAAAGDTVIALPGLYQGGVVLDKKITLRGLGAVIDASSSPSGNGVQIAGPGGSGSTVEGFKIKNAKFEGILVGTAPVAITTTNGTPVTSGTPVTNVTIADNVLVHNGTGFGTTAGQCFSTPNAPGDCGETIHLVSVTNSVVKGNYVADNLGGILMTDEFGPTSGNVIKGNRSLDNTDDCGITLAGHNPAAVNPGTGQPTGAAGVFDNRVIGNISNGNGVAGQGAGILLGGGAPFAGVYDNVIRNNVAIGNGLAGITLHQHFAGDLSGNVIERNFLSNDNLDGDFDFGAAAAAQTTGILIAAGLPPGPGPFPPGPGPLTGTIVRGNTIANVKVGIWTLGVDPATTVIAHNHFGPGVTTPVSTN
jgi:nitrous oxidase accessory protein NosD